MQQTTEPIKKSLRRSSSLLTKQVIAIFKNETFEEIDESQIQQHRHNNVQLETLDFSAKGKPEYIKCD